MIKAIIFDIGGVLAYDVWEHLLLDKEEGIAALHHLNPQAVWEYGKVLWEEFAHLPAGNEKERKMLEAAYWKKFSKKFSLPHSPEHFINLTDKFIQPVEGMTPLLEKLKSSEVMLAICSNNTEFWLHRQVEKLGLTRFFRPENVISSCKIGVSKSSPNYEMFRAVINSLNGITPFSCLFIDDRWPNIQRALEFGMKGIIFPAESKHGAAYLSVLLSCLSLL
ncbi:MAG: hypothetical protein CV087_23550 [Candidatus Brocadia sp. WS118]|nr:MAG: hypothetical protein CV087_23550 [Candidatus Brocadia sp. WS118]